MTTYAEYEQSAQIGQTLEITSNGLDFVVRRLSSLEHNAAIQVGLARAESEGLPDSLDPNNPDHEEMWRLVSIQSEIVAASVVSWPFENEPEPEILRQFGKNSPLHMITSLVAAAVPRFSMTLKEERDLGNGSSSESAGG